MFVVECRYCANLSADICYVAGNMEELTNGSRAKPSSRRCVTVAEFIDNLKCLVQKFPNGLPISKLAAEYKVMYA